MIAALITFGLIAAIALLIPVSFKIISFIHGYKQFQRRDDSFFFFMFFANIVCHMIVDNAKANDKVINLVQDQSAHIAQIA